MNKSRKLILFLGSWLPNNQEVLVVLGSEPEDELAWNSCIRKLGIQDERQDRSFDIRKQKVDPFPGFLAS